MQKNIVFRKIVYEFGRSRAKGIFRQINPYLKKHDKILDIGAGTCNVSEILSEKHFDVTSLDVKNLSFVDDIKPIIYGGDKLPFNGNKFDVALILYVLHHTKNFERIILEAKRVSKRIIIIEDVYMGVIHKYLTYLLDSLLNLEFAGHPHTNKKDGEWKKLFKKLGLKLRNTKYRRWGLVMKHAYYCLEK